MNKVFHLKKAYYACLYFSPTDIVTIEAPHFTSYAEAWNWIFAQGDRLPKNASAVEVYL